MGDYDHESRKRGPDDESRPRKQRRTGKIVKVLCPFYSAGAVIGKGGDQIKLIKDKTDASIEVSKNTVRFPNTDERVITIQGELEALKEVVKFVQDKIRADKIPPHVKNIDPSANDKRKSACKIIVSDRSVGKLIGKGGENVNQLKDKYNTTIGIMKKEESVANLGERIVSVEGEYDDVDNCISDIIEQIHEHDATLDYYVDYSRFGGRGFGNDVDKRGGYDRGYERGDRSGGYGDRGNYGSGRGGRGGYSDRSGYGDRASGYGSGQGRYSNGDGYGDRGYGSGYNDRSSQPRGYNDRYDAPPSSNYGGGYNDRQGYSSGGGRGYDY